MSAPTCCTIGHGSYPALREVFVADGYDGAWFPYCLACAETLGRSGEKVRHIYGTASFRSDDGPGYPNWTLHRMGDIFRAAGKLMAVYNAAPMDQPPDMDFYRQQMRVLYDLLHEDGR